MSPIAGMVAGIRRRPGLAIAGGVAAAGIGLLAAKAGGKLLRKLRGRVGGSYRAGTVAKLRARLTRLKLRTAIEAQKRRLLRQQLQGM